MNDLKLMATCGFGTLMTLCLCRDGSQLRLAFDVAGVPTIVRETCEICDGTKVTT